MSDKLFIVIYSFIVATFGFGSLFLFSTNFLYYPDSLAYPYFTETYICMIPSAIYMSILCETKDIKLSHQIICLFIGVIISVIGSYCLSMFSIDFLDFIIILFGGYILIAIIVIILFRTVFKN